MRSLNTIALLRNALLLLVLGGLVIPGALAQCEGPVVGGSNLTSGAPWNASTVPDPVVWPNNYPPTNGGAGGVNCTVCPSTFSIQACAGNNVPMYLCAGNVYQFSLCSSAVLWDSYLTISNTANSFVFSSDDDACGVTDGHAFIEFIPTVSQVYRIRVFQDPCLVNATACGLLQIQCFNSPQPPANDDPCGAINLPVAATCNPVPATTLWATASPPSPPTCGGYAGYDVWFSAAVPASGNIGFSTALLGATDLGIAAYSTPSCSGAFTQVACQIGGAPSLAISGLTAGSTVYVRVWPLGGPQGGGDFTVCAVAITPPPNDNPCGAIALPAPVDCNLATYNTTDATPLGLNMTAVPAIPTCGTPVAGGDLWFTVTMPASGAANLLTLPGSLTDMAMAVYTLSGPACGPATLTQVNCNDNDPTNGLMPSLSFSGTPGQVFYVRVWNRTASAGTFQICARSIDPPVNDNPCGAIPLGVGFGCLYETHNNQNATLTTPANSGVTIPPLTCGGVAQADVWFSAVVPPNGILAFSTESIVLNDAALAVYTATGSCATNSLSLTEMACVTNGSTYDPDMPEVNVGGLPPGATVYIRLWRQSGADGPFLLCAQRTDIPPGDCAYVVRLYDSGANGWNSSQLLLCVDGVCTDLSIGGSYGEWVFGANIGQTITLEYVGAGVDHFENAFLFTTATGVILYSSTVLPTFGVVYATTVNGLCNIPPQPAGDCTGAVSFCSPAIVSATPLNTGNMTDLDVNNQGCLDGERQGMWFTFLVATPGTLAFTITPNTPAYTNFDFALWGPMQVAACPPQEPPIRCSWATPELPYTSGATGLTFGAGDQSEGLFGDGWVEGLNVQAGETYLLYVDNFGMSGASFTLNWANENSATVGCLFLPVEMIRFNATPSARTVLLDWATVTEHNSSHFEVQRSTDLENWTGLGHVPAAGFAQQLNTYGFVDDQPVMGLNYYRLRQVDLDGQAVYTNVVSALMDEGPGRLLVHPNPATDMLFATLDRPADGTLSWLVMDPSGRLVDTGSLGAVSGTNRLRIPLVTLDAGAYLLQVVDATGAPLGIARFIKQ